MCRAPRSERLRHCVVDLSGKPGWRLAYLGGVRGLSRSWGGIWGRVWGGIWERKLGSEVAESARVLIIPRLQTLNKPASHLNSALQKNQPVPQTISFVLSSSSTEPSSPSTMYPFCSKCVRSSSSVAGG